MVSRPMVDLLIEGVRGEMHALVEPLPPIVSLLEAGDHFWDVCLPVLHRVSADLDLGERRDDGVFDLAGGLSVWRLDDECGLVLDGLGGGRAL